MVRLSREERCSPRASSCWSGTRKSACRATRWSTAPSSARCSRGWCTTARPIRATRSCWARWRARPRRRSEQPPLPSTCARSGAVRQGAPDPASARRGVGAHHGDGAAGVGRRRGERRRLRVVRALARTSLRAGAREGGRGRLRWRRATTRCSTTTSRDDDGSAWRRCLRSSQAELVPLVAAARARRRRRVPCSRATFPVERQKLFVEATARRSASICMADGSTSRTIPFCTTSGRATCASRCATIRTTSRRDSLA